MLKKLDKCLKCNNTCKLETETNANLISCPLYLSKRSVAVQKEKGKRNVCPANKSLS
jgi:flagellar biosynthesis regulator FlaF